MSPIVVIVPGWAETPEDFAPLARTLTVRGLESVCVDLGFFGREVIPSLPSGRSVVAVGHSLGALWLLRQAPFRIDRFVSLSGIARFTATDGFPHGVPAEALSRMRASLQESPEATVRGFWRKSGRTSAASFETMNHQALEEGLRRLADWDARERLDPLHGRILALAGSDDTIVPFPLARANFPECIQVTGAGHALPFTHAELCASSILTAAMEIR